MKCSEDILVIRLIFERVKIKLIKGAPLRSWFSEDKVLLIPKFGAAELWGKQAAVRYVKGEEWECWNCFYRCMMMESLKVISNVLKKDVGYS
jgi:hypothetical protein